MAFEFDQDRVRMNQHVKYMYIGHTSLRSKLSGVNIQILKLSHMQDRLLLLNH